MKSLQIFLSCSLKENMYKSGLKTRGHIKNITKIEQKRPLLFTFFYGVPRAKTDLHSKYMI